MQSTARQIGRRLLPSLADSAFVGVFLFVLLLGQFLSNRDGDLGRHIAVGRAILSARQIPTLDLFSYPLRGQVFVPHEWLAEIAFAASHHVAGFSGVAWLTACAIALPFGGLMATMLRRGVRPLVAGTLLTLGVLSSISHWAARPHVFTFVFVWIWATTLEDFRRRRRTHVWLLIPLTIVWANTHGAFIVGHVLIATYLAGSLITGQKDSARHLGIVLVSCLLAALVHPSGVQLIANSLGYLNKAFLLQFTPEYNSPDFHNPLFFPFLLLLLLAMVASVRRELTPMLLLVSWAAFGLYSFRNIALFVIICLPLLAEAIDDHVTTLRQHVPVWIRNSARALNEGLRPGHARAAGHLPAAVTVALLAVMMARGSTLALDKGDYGFREGEFPVAALASIGARPPGSRVFNEAMWGGYLLFAASPPIPVFIDGQTDFYGEAHTRDYARVLDAEDGWEGILECHGVDWVFVRSQRPLVRWLAVHPGWQLHYQDDTATIYVRRAVR
jgi:hypothetical protein